MLPTVVARGATNGEQAAYDGVVEAVRQTVIAAQVPGAIVQLDVKAGDRVKQVKSCCVSTPVLLIRRRSPARRRCGAARASLDVAKADLARQQQLFQKNYIQSGCSGACSRHSSKPPKRRSTRSWRRQVLPARKPVSTWSAPLCGCGVGGASHAW